MESDLKLKTEFRSTLPQEVLDGIDQIAALDMEDAKQGAIDAEDLDPEERDDVEVEFKRFMALELMRRMDVFTSEPLGPTGKVDGLWHAFILYTQEYVSFSNNVMGGYVHHVPDTPILTGSEMRSLLTTHFDDVDTDDIWAGDLCICWTCPE
jgi:hypothetical protein